MRLSKVLTATAFAGVMALAATGPASAATIDGISFPAGAVFKSTNIFETVVVNPGDVLGGIGIVNNISAGGSPPFTWVNGQNGRELTFQFLGYTVQSVVITGSTAEILFSGGTVDFYSDSTPNFNANSGNQAADILTAIDGNLWLSLIGANINDPIANCSTVTCFNGASTVITLKASVDFVGNLNTVQTGQGKGFLDVVSGPAAFNFNTNNQPGGQDILLTSSFAGAAAGTSSFPISGTADLRSTAIPEPATLALFGFGLLGLGFATRRRRRHTAA